MSHLIIDPQVASLVNMAPQHLGNIVLFIRIKLQNKYLCQMSIKIWRIESCKYVLNFFKNIILLSFENVSLFIHWYTLHILCEIIVMLYLDVYMDLFCS